MAESLVKLKEGIFSGHCARSSGQCVSWDVISTGTIDDIKTEAEEFKSPTQELLVLYLPTVMLVEHVGHRFLVSFQDKVSPSKEVSPMPHRFYYGLGFLLYGCMLQFTALKGS